VISARRWSVAAVLAMATLLGACGGGSSTTTKLSALPVATVDGVAAGTLADHIERFTVVNVWATWCAPCKREMPAFEEVHRRRGDSVAFIGVNTGDGSTAAAKFVASLGITYTQFLDEPGDALTAFGLSGLPATVLVGADGNVITAHVGELSGADLDRLIDKLLPAT
jgi:thiol-disulfide isomerase/thioredoxin